MKLSFRRATFAAVSLSTLMAASAGAGEMLTLKDGADAGGGTAGIEVESWSFGASNAGTMNPGPASSGKVAVHDMTVMSVASPRDAATGMASGKRMAAPPAGESAPSEPKVGELASVSVRLRESPTRASLAVARSCASGQHIPSATFSNDKRTVELQDVTVSGCAIDGAFRVYEFRGHVTLMK